MLKWVKALNKMYAEHPYTSDGRVVVSYCADMDTVVIKVWDKYRVLALEDFNDIGILFAIQKTIEEMY